VVRLDDQLLFLLQVCMLVTLEPVLGDHIWDKEKWSYKTGDLVNEVQ
jgi:hypothetical protein